MSWNIQGVYTAISFQKFLAYDYPLVFIQQYYLTLFLYRVNDLDLQFTEYQATPSVFPISQKIFFLLFLNYRTKN